MTNVDIEANGLEKLDRSTVTIKEYNRKYQRARKRQQKGMVFTPAETTMLKNYYDEYKMRAQQDLYPVVDFHQFIVQFCICGYLASREKHKGK